MEILKTNIDHYMKLKGIKQYSHLLIDIAHELGIKGQDAYDFANREKSNFAKMLRGERPLKYQFIIPLEKIFGVSLARLLDENAYKLPVEKDNVPFNKGYRYYAYLDDPELYKNEFDILLAKDGKSILTQSDEFGKTYLDYMVEYHSVNGVKYLHNEYGITLKRHPNLFYFDNGLGSTWIDFENLVEFARLVASMNDTELFNDIFDSYYMFISCGRYDTNRTIFCQGEYLEIILDNDDLFNSIFRKRQYKYVLHKSLKFKEETDSITYNLINPIINNCLRYALNHLDSYRQRTITMLKFGIKHNKEILNKAGNTTYYICDDLGGVKTKPFNSYDNCDVEDIAVFVDTEVNDKEINALIKQLPKFKKL